MKLKKLNDEVFVAEDAIVKLGPSEIAFVKQQAVANRRQRARICAHKSNEDALHEMVIGISAKSYIHPHRHLEKSESFHIVEGAVDVVVFDNAGAVIDIIELGDITTGRLFFYRLDQSAFHTLLLKTEFLVVHEVTNGPFMREKTVLAPWAPSEDQPEQASAYMKHVLQLAQQYRAATGRTA